jgi:Uma2 family endonuclease
MNIQSRHPTTADEFLRWNEGREGKREFVRGRVVEMMINVTRRHWQLASRLMLQLASQVGVEQYNVGAAEFGVRTGEGVRFPDVMIETFSGDGKALATNSPLFLAEVLSPSTMADDFGQKARDYLALETLQHYLTLSQDEVRVWLWSRDDRRQWMAPEIVESGQVTLRIDGKPILIDLDALYRGIVGN